MKRLTWNSHKMSFSHLICSWQQISIFSQIAVWNRISTEMSQELIILITPTHKASRCVEWPWRFSSPTCFVPVTQPSRLLFSRELHQGFLQFKYKMFTHELISTASFLRSAEEKESEKPSPEWFIRFEGKLQCM